MATTYKTVTLKGDPIHLEGVASGSVTPGHLVEQTSATARTFKVHATAGGNAERIFALENELIGETVDDAYLTTEYLFVGVFRRGDVVQALLTDGVSYAVGDALESAGDGTLRKHTKVSSSVPTEAIIAYVDEARDLLTSGSTDPAKCPVRIA